MRKSITLSVPEPCHEKWNEMTPNEQGRHCAVCTKTVVDFTRKTDREIAKLVQTGTSLCGRFKKDQLDRPITLARKRDALFEMIPSSYAASLLIPISIFGTQHAVSQETTIPTPVEQTSTYESLEIGSQVKIRGRVAVTPVASGTFLLKGTIYDENGPLVGVNIMVKGTHRGTQTNTSGAYELNVSQGETLVISHLGYHTQEAVIDSPKGTHLNIAMEPDDDILGDIIILGMIVEPKTVNTLPVQKTHTPKKNKKKEE